MSKKNCSKPCAMLLRYSGVALLWLWAAVSVTAANIAQSDLQILQKAGINIGDYDEYRFEINEEGHIRNINLSKCGLKQSTLSLLSLMELPQIELIYLHDNQLSGDIGALTESFLQSSPVISQRLRLLTISQNKLTGDIGPLVALLNTLPDFYELDAQENCISEASVIARDEVMVFAEGQHPDVLVDFDLNNQSYDDLYELLPGIIRYGDYGHNSEDRPDMLFYRNGEHVASLLLYSGYVYDIPHGVSFQNGEVFDVWCGNASFRVRLLFGKGDVNFSGAVDEEDFYHIFSYIATDGKMDNFNITAADLNDDAVINMSDMVSLSNMLAGVTPEPVARQGENKLIIDDLLFNSEEMPLPIRIDNADNIVALQFDLLLPDEFEADFHQIFGERVNENSWYYWEEIACNNGKRIYRFIVMSTDGGIIINGHTGDLITLTLLRPADVTTTSFPIEVDNVVFCTKDGQNVFTSASLGSITFNMSVGEDEWNILQMANLTQMTDDGPKPFWDFSGGVDTVQDLRGVVIENGHITKLNLKGNRLTGPFPFVLTTLPYLEELNLYTNPLLTGDIGEQAEAFRQTNPEVSEYLTRIDIDNCDFEGNIGTLISLYPTLECLYANDNRLTGISPLPDHELSCDFGNQRYDNLTIDLNTATMTTADFLGQLPEIARYDEADNMLSNTIHILCYDMESQNNVLDVLTNEDGTWSFWTDGTYYENGERFIAKSSNGHYYLRLFFTKGDADFDGHIDVADVQRLANVVAYDDNGGWDGCNAAAADMNNDSVLNVLDIVLVVNEVLKLQPQAVPAYIPQPNAWLSCVDGQLVVNTKEPVAAFDILLGNSEAIALSKELEATGMTFSVEQREGRVHLVGWSLTGQTLPAGRTILGQVDEKARVTGAVLVDEAARRLKVMAAPDSNGVSAPRLTDSNDGYEMRIGHGHSIRIDNNSHKTLEKNK